MGFVSDQYSILKGEDIEKEATKLRDRVSKYVEDEYKVLKNINFNYLTNMHQILSLLILS